MIVELGVETGAFGRDLDESIGRIEKFSDAAERVGRRMTMGFTLPIVGAATAAVKAASDTETAMVQVAKVTDATGAELKNLKDDFTGLSEEIPKSRDELLGLAAIGGQLGVPVEDLREFSKVVAQMATAADDLNAEQAASQMAKLAAVMQTPREEFRNLGSAITDLGNKMNATEGELLDMGRRIAAAGAVAGMSEGDVLGFAAGLTEVGIRAEAGGTAISRVFSDMGAAVHSGSEELDQFAEVAGLSSEAFAELFKNDAAEAAVRFIEGLEGINASGGDVYTTLENLGLGNARVRDTLLSASQAAGSLRKAIDIGNDSYREATALEKEAALAADTFAKRLETVKNKAVNVAAFVGDMLIPAIDTFAQAIDPVLSGLRFMAQQFAKLPQPIKATVGGLLLFAVAAGPILLVTSALAKAYGSALALGGALKLLKGIGTFTKIAAGAGTVASKTAELATTFPKLAGKMGAVRNAATIMWAAMTGPVGIVIAAVVAIVGVLYLFRDQLKGVNAAIGNFVKGAISSFYDLMKDISAAIGNIAATIQEGFLDALAVFITAFLTPFILLWEGIKAAIASEVAEWVYTAMVGMNDLIVNIGTAIGEVAYTIATGINDAVYSFAAAIGDMILVAAQGIGRIAETILRGFEIILLHLYNWAGGMVQGMLEAVTGMINAFYDIPVVAAVHDFFARIGETIVRGFRIFVEWGRKLGQGLIDGIMGKVKNIPVIGDFIEKRLGKQTGKKTGANFGKEFARSARREVRRVQAPQFAEPVTQQVELPDAQAKVEVIGLEEAREELDLITRAVENLPEGSERWNQAVERGAKLQRRVRDAMGEQNGELNEQIVGYAEVGRELDKALNPDKIRRSTNASKSQTAALKDQERAADRNAAAIDRMREAAARLAVKVGDWKYLQDIGITNVAESVSHIQQAKNEYEQLRNQVRSLRQEIEQAGSYAPANADEMLAKQEELAAEAQRHLEFVAKIKKAYGEIPPDDLQAKMDALFNPDMAFQSALDLEKQWQRISDLVGLPLEFAPDVTGAIDAFDRLMHFYEAAATDLAAAQMAGDLTTAGVIEGRIAELEDMISRARAAVGEALVGSDLPHQAKQLVIDNIDAKVEGTTLDFSGVEKELQKYPEAIRDAMENIIQGMSATSDQMEGLNIKDRLDLINEAFQHGAGTVQQWPRLYDSVTAAIVNVADTAGRMVGSVKAAIADPLGTLARGFRAAGGMLLNAAGKIAGALNPIALFGSVLDEVARGMAPDFASALKPLQPVFKKLADAITPVIGVFAEALMPMLDALVPIVEELAPVIGFLAEIFGALLTAVMPILKAMVPIIKGFLPLIKLTAIAFTYVGQVAAFLGGVLLKVASGVAWALGSLIYGIGVLVKMIPGDRGLGERIKSFGNGIKDMGKGFSEAGSAMFEAVGEFGKARELIQNMELKDALDSAAFKVTEFEETLQGFIDKHKLLTNVFDLDESPLVELQTQLYALGKFAPEIGATFADLDAGTEEGRAAIEEALREWAMKAAAGLLTADELGELEFEEFIGILNTADKALDSYEDSVRDAADAADEMTEAMRGVPAGFKDTIDMIRYDVAQVGRKVVKEPQGAGTEEGPDHVGLLEDFKRLMEEMVGMVKGAVEGPDVGTPSGGGITVEQIPPPDIMPQPADIELAVERGVTRALRENVAATPQAGEPQTERQTIIELDGRVIYDSTRHYAQQNSRTQTPDVQQTVNLAWPA